jgi:hypothetical protein
MKLQLLAIVVSFVPTLGGEMLSPSPSNSVCNHKKTSSSGWLPLPPTQHLSPPGSFSFTPPLLQTRILPSS